MSEFGSSKSYSSVSESSTSSGSQPPSSSSEEVHTCHRCGDCCYSDKHYLIVNAAALVVAQLRDGQDCEAGSPGFPGQGLLDALSVNNLRLDPYSFAASITHRTAFDAAIAGHAIGDPEYQAAVEAADDAGYHFGATTGGSVTELKTVLSTQASRDCTSNEWSLQIAIVGYQKNSGTWEATGSSFFVVAQFNDPCGLVSAPIAAHACCGANGKLLALLAGDVYGPANWSIEVHNNPCCTQVGWHDCFQHFNGDCRGDCDEPPSSSSDSSSSSGENPLP